MKKSVIDIIKSRVQECTPDGWMVRDEVTSGQTIYECESTDIACGVMATVLDVLYEWGADSQGAAEIIFDEENPFVVIKDFD